MRKYLTTGLFSAILGLAVGAPADAALVSRGFLDEALENYATTTALDLKANQSDFTDLNTEISGSVDVLRQLLEQGGYSYEFVNSIDPEKFPNTISGASFLLYQYLERFAGSILHGWTDSNGTYYAGFADLNNGWTDSEKKTYLGVKGLNDKISTLPDGYETVGAALTAIKGIAEDARAAALSAIPDPKAEGSTGKFVLTVDIVGDNATYRWEKIDREGETTTTE